MDVIAFLKEYSALYTAWIIAYRIDSCHMGIICNL